ncbi:GNAT family N-acetyltransferase [Streptomyces sp. NPDC094031]|uniref:GNAT family N-acetyltransferase n=1 Tax=Streptomyces sp. NPDC094031 TaxID=3155307 RepID=UPI0033240EDA
MPLSAWSTTPYGTLARYVTRTRTTRPPSSPVSPDRRVEENGIAVRPGRRRREAASALLIDCEDYLAEEGARVMLAEVRPRSVEFFAARGYATVPGPALVIPTTAGTYVHGQTTPTTTLMWKSVFGGPARRLIRRRAAPGAAAVPPPADSTQKS